MTKYKFANVPSRGEGIVYKSGTLSVPDNPIIPFVEGDGTGPDIWRASVRVFDAAVEKAYQGARKVAWMEVFAGEKSFKQFNDWLPQETVDAMEEYRVSIKGPLTTPVGGGIRSLNVTLRQVLDLYACIRPVRYFEGVGAPVKEPEKVDVVIFRENTEDVYAGIEWKAGSPEAEKIADYLRREYKSEIREKSALGVKPMSEFGSKRLVEMAIRHAIANDRESVTLVHKGNIMKFTEGAFRDWGYEVAREKSALGVKPMSEFGSKRLVEMAIRHAIANDRESVTLVHKGNIMKFTEGAFRDWGYEVAREKFPNDTCTEAELAKGGETARADAVVMRDRIADSMFQQMLLRPAEYSVIATPNLNGDYLSDAAAAQVGGLGIAPGGNVGDGVAVFEATHGTAPKYANLDKINPGSVILSGVMMFEYMGWNEAAALIIKGMEHAIKSKRVTYDLARQMPGATEVSTSAFGDQVIAGMKS